MTAGPGGARVLTMRQTNPPGTEDRAQRRYVLAGHPNEVGRIAPGLHIVATPIGNLGDITLRALATLAGADLIACEDTRVTRKLLDRYAIATPLTPYHDHNAAAARPKLLRRLAEGAAIALVSDAGTPLAAFGELGLTGELRWVGHPDRRLAEARKFGLETVIAPVGSDGCDAATLRDALAVALPRAAASQSRPRVAA